MFPVPFIVWNYCSTIPLLSHTHLSHSPLRMSRYSQQPSRYHTPTITDDNFALHQALVRRQLQEGRTSRKDERRAAIRYTLLAALCSMIRGTRFCIGKLHRAPSTQPTPSAAPHAPGPKPGFARHAN
ncbi:MAG: hypothetical protein ACC661_03830 [Verrucomicrobiales bacterium]